MPYSLNWYEKVAGKQGLSNCEFMSYVRQGGQQVLNVRDGESHDAHVLHHKARNKLLGSNLNKLLVCNRCGRQVSRKDWPREPSGAKRPHCGCRTGKHKTSTYGLAGLSRAEYSRMARLMALPGVKPVLHNEHVLERKRQLSRARAAEAEAKRHRQQQQRELTADQRALQKKRARMLQQADATRQLSDVYVAKRLKKNMPALKGVRIPVSLIEAERQRLKLIRLINDKESYEQLR